MVMTSLKGKTQREKVFTIHPCVRNDVAIIGLYIDSGRNGNVTHGLYYNALNDFQHSLNRAFLFFLYVSFHFKLFAYFDASAWKIASCNLNG